MNKDRFLEMVREQVQLKMPMVDVNITSVVKNNGIVYRGIQLRSENGNVFPVVYLDEAYEHYCDGDESMDDIVDFVTRVGNRKTPEISTESILNYEKVKDRLRIKLINASKNEEMLKTTPHLVFGDLAVVFQIQFECSVADLATTTVTDHILKMWDGVDLDTLFKDAEINCRKNVKIRPMLSLLASMRNLDFDVPDTPEEMYVLTNSDMTNGAAQMLFPENLDQIAEELGTSKVFIIPSSIHECIVVPGDSLNVDIIEQMISEVNETTVAAEDILSGTLYMYDTDHREYSIAQSGRKCFMSAAA